jgi:hypothetical protein
MLWILRIPSHAPNLNHGSCAGSGLCDDGRQFAGFAGPDQQDRPGRADNPRRQEKNTTHDAPFGWAYDCALSCPCGRASGWTDGWQPGQWRGWARDGAIRRAEARDGRENEHGAIEGAFAIPSGQCAEDSRRGDKDSNQRCEDSCRGDKESDQTGEDPRRGGEDFCRGD